MLNQIKARYDWSSWADKLGLLTIFFILFTNLLMPESLGLTRLENVLLPLLLIALGMVGEFKSNKAIIYSLLGLFIISVFSNLINVKGWESYINSVRYVKYVLIFLITGHLIEKNGVVLHYVISVFTIALVLINLLQVFNPLDWGYELLKLYSNHSQNYEINRVFNKSFRLFGTQNNPNDNAIMWGMLGMYYFVRNLDKPRLANVVAISFSILFLLLTQSRTNLVGLVLAFSMYYFFKNLGLKTFFKLIAIFGIVFIAISVSGLSYMQQIILNNPLKIHSLQLRFEIWEKLITLWKQFPFFGLGLETKFEDIVGNAPDNEFLFYLASGGVFLTIPYVLLFVSILVVGFKNIQSKNAYYGLYILLPVFLLVNSITNYSLNNVKITSLFFILLALVNSKRAGDRKETDLIK